MLHSKSLKESHEKFRLTCPRFMTVAMELNPDDVEEDAPRE